MTLWLMIVFKCNSKECAVSFLLLLLLAIEPPPTYPPPTSEICSTTVFIRL